MQTVAEESFIKQFGALSHYLRKSGYQLFKLSSIHPGSSNLSRMTVNDLLNGWQSGDRQCLKILTLFDRLLFDIWKNISLDRSSVVEAAILSFFRMKGQNLCGFVSQLIALNYMVGDESFRCTVLEGPSGWDFSETELVLESPETSNKYFVTVHNLYPAVHDLEDKGKFLKYLKTEISRPQFDKTLGLKPKLDVIKIFVIWFPQKSMQISSIRDMGNSLRSLLPSSVRVLTWRAIVLDEGQAIVSYHSL